MSLLRKKRVAVKTPVGDGKKCRVKPSFKEKCDINKIMERYEKTGVITHVNQKEPQYGDFTGLTDLTEAMEKVRRAEEGFLALPAALRARFNNDPTELIGFIENLSEEQVSEAQDLGLIEVVKKQTEPKVEAPAPPQEPQAPAEGPASE
jgi:phage internal scaffolding protein